MGSDYTPDQIEFMRALDSRKRTTHRVMLEPADVLQVADELGYKPPAAPEVPGPDLDCESWLRDALAAYRLAERHRYLTCCEVLAVLVGLGWTKR